MALSSPPTLLPLDQILTGDCRQVLNDLPEKSIDLVFADPPYNLQLQQQLYRPNNTRVDAVNDTWDQFSGFAEYDTFTRSWLEASRRVMKDNAALWVIGTYHNIYRIGAILQDLGFWILNDIAWVKDNPMPNFRGVRFTNAHETLIWAVKSKAARYTFNYQSMKAINEGLQMRSDWRLPICSGPERARVNGQKAHPTQKPIALLYRVILATSHPGDVVLDPFFGTGTTGAVARLLGRHWIGVEQEERYIAVAQERIARVQPAPLESLELPRRTRRKREERLRFAALVETGLLRPGQNVYFKGDRAQPALILANGHLRAGDFTGSIHQMALHLSGAPSNGWECWSVEDENGELVSIDIIRQQLNRTTPSENSTLTG